MEVIAYYRVSTDEQAASGLGLEAQRAAVTAAAVARGWTIAAEYTDLARSGKNTNRPALAEALAYAERTGATVMVSKLARLSRSVGDFARMAERARRRGWSIVALDVDVDTTTPNGELVANIVASVAQWERRRNGDRTTEALQAKKAAGARLGRPVTLDLEVRRMIADRHAAGASLAGLARELNENHVPTARGGRWYASTVRAVLASLELDAAAVALGEAA